MSNQSWHTIPIDSAYFHRMHSTFDKGMNKKETNTENANSLGCLGVGSISIGALFGLLSLITIPGLILGCISLLFGNTDDPFGNAHIQDEQVRAYSNVFSVLIPIVSGGIALFLIKFGLWQSKQSEENNYEKNRSNQAGDGNSE